MIKFQIPSVQHYLVIIPQGRRVVHYRRRTEAEPEATVLSAGLLSLDPPGLTLAVDALFPRLG